jgi:cystine transport system substrate-binding protein
VTRLDALARSARLSRQTIAQTRSAQRSLAGLRRTLAARAAELQHLLAQAEQTTAALEQARGRRLAYLAALARERNLNANQIRRLDSAAQQIAARSQTITLEQGTLPAVPEQQSTNGQTLTVSSTGYSLPGHTATGMPVGWGVVAVDPSVIPLGTRMTIPGYGEGVAADVGSAVRGATIDLWFPTLDQARAWGRRTVTITLH